MSAEPDEPKELSFPAEEVPSQHPEVMEEVLLSLEGVDSVTVVPGHGTAVDEIHVLSDSDRSPKQIVRNVESALLAELGIDVDHRIISIARTKSELPEVESGEYARETPARDDRLELTDVRIEREAGRRMTCRVVLRDEEEDEEYVGEAQGVDRPDARIEAAAKAVLNALAESGTGKSDMALRGTKTVDAFGGTVVLAMVHGWVGRSTVPLTGAAAVEDSPEEAAVLAVLQATNRWSSREE